mmetsp:Transcript_7601/g.18302  ORF Transcript_7601/g.18302 Transcript_7601/m.18302 type:complete len:141 (+) Transcript_7601:1316-1738(+)
MFRSVRQGRANAHKTNLRPFSNSVPVATEESSDFLSTSSEHLRLAHSLEPIPFSRDIEISPVNQNGDLGHKKFSVVGCGQVGMAIAYSVLNQQSAGTLALVDMNREKLEGEAKDLEQGSAFHQQVRILASDEYVSLFDSY